MTERRTKKQRLVAIAKRERKLLAEAPAIAGLIGSVRPKRPPGGFWAMGKLYVPVPLALKCVVMRIAREHGMSQGELGLVIVSAAVADEVWLAAVLKRE